MSAHHLVFLREICSCWSFGTVQEALQQLSEHRSCDAMCRRQSSPDCCCKRAAVSTTGKSCCPKISFLVRACNFLFAQPHGFFFLVFYAGEALRLRGKTSIKLCRCSTLSQGGILIRPQVLVNISEKCGCGIKVHHFTQISLPMHKNVGWEWIQHSRTLISSDLVTTHSLTFSSQPLFIAAWL